MDVGFLGGGLEGAAFVGVGSFYGWGCDVVI